MGESKLLLALFCNKILTKSEQGVVVVVISWRSGCVTLTVTLQLYRGGECAGQRPLPRRPEARLPQRSQLTVATLNLNKEINFKLKSKIFCM